MHVYIWQVLQWVEEEKRQRKLVSLLKGQRDIKQTEALRAQQAEKETAEQVRGLECISRRIRYNHTSGRKAIPALLSIFSKAVILPVLNDLGHLLRSVSCVQVSWSAYS